MACMAFMSPCRQYRITCVAAQRLHKPDSARRRLTQPHNVLQVTIALCRPAIDGENARTNAETLLQETHGPCCYFRHVLPVEGKMLTCTRSLEEEPRAKLKFASLVQTLFSQSKHVRYRCMRPQYNEHHRLIRRACVQHGLSTCECQVCLDTTLFLSFPHVSRHRSL